MEQKRNIKMLNGNYKHIFPILILASMPLLSCMMICLKDGVHLNQIYIANSTYITWNDELFYYKMIEGVAEYGQPLGYFGYNGNHANIGRFGAWSPVLLMLHVIYARLFGWSMLSPIYCNIIFMTIAMAVFAYLVRPTKRQILFICLLYSSCTVISRYVLSMMMEVPIYALLLPFIGLLVMVSRQPKDEFKLCHIMLLNLLVFILVLMRPYWLILLIFPGYYWYKNAQKKSIILMEGIWGFFCIALNFFISYIFCAEYFDQGIIDLELLRLLRHNPLKGTLNIILYIGSGMREILQSIKAGIFNGYPEGGIYLIFLMAIIYFIYEVYHHKKTERNKAWISACWLFCFCSMLLAIIFLYDISYGARHAIGFLVLFIFIFSLTEMSRLKYAIFLIAFVWVFCIKLKDVVICPIPTYTDEKAASLQKGKEELVNADFLNINSDNPWDNTIIWIYQDETKTDFTYFYALPEGVGIELYFKDAVLLNFEELQPRYILTNIGEEVDLLCAQEEKKMIAEYGNVHIWRLRE